MDGNTKASSHVEEASRAESWFPRMCDHSRKALMRSQGGPGAGLALSTLFRVVLLRRLHLPLSLPCVTAGVTSHSMLVATTGSLCARWGVGRERLGSGERCSKDLP